MKLIIAYIQPQKLNEVKQALSDADVGKMSVTNALGCGQQKGYEESYRGSVLEVNLLQKVRLEIGVNDEFVGTVVEAIVSAAKTGSCAGLDLRRIGLQVTLRSPERGPARRGVPTLADGYGSFFSRPDPDAFLDGNPRLNVLSR